MLALFAAAPLAVVYSAPARSADVDSGAPSIAPPGAFSFFEEIRGGVFYGDLRTRANHSISDAFETLSSPLPFYSVNNPFLNAFLNPRINFGAMFSLQGATSYVYSGLTWRIPVYDRLFFEGEFGDAVNNSSRTLGTSRTDLGCPVTFRESGGLGYQLTPAINIVASVEHISHAGLCGRLNPGLTNFGARLGYRF